MLQPPLSELISFKHVMMMIWHASLLHRLSHSIQMNQLYKVSSDWKDVDNLKNVLRNMTQEKHFTEWRGGDILHIFPHPLKTSQRLHLLCFQLLRNIEERE